MEGITGYIFRNAYHKFYGNIDKYFAPFMSPADRCPMNPKEKRDVIPENNDGIYLVPQILTCKSNHFIEAATELSYMGYSEINLNLGCPSGTVCSKGKGAGFLNDAEKLDVFLEDIYDYGLNNHMEISLKVRLGYINPDDFFDLLEIYNKYPVKELIIHPRVRNDYYKGKPRIEYFSYALERSRNKAIYNGNIFGKKDLDNLLENNIDISSLMLGRGLLYNPELCKYIKEDCDHKEFDYKNFRKFHDEIYMEYQKIMSPDINVLYRMKELWTYWRELFPDKDKIIKNLLKTKKYVEYESCLRQLGL